MPNNNKRTPPPAHPRERRRPLPSQNPKSAQDEPATPEALRAILGSKSYREADQDVDFLQGDPTRGVRLQLDYLKAETLLRESGVAHTIVVFGSTRISEPQAARREVAGWTAAASANEADPEIPLRLATAKRIEAKTHYYEAARELGRIVGSNGDKTLGGRIMIMTGGGPGIMEAANRGAHDVGAKSIGLNITLPREQFPNPYVTPELCFTFHYFAIRKLHFLLRARALVAFPGGYGTLDEIFEVLALAQTRKLQPVPVILVGESYWRQVFNPQFLIEEGVIEPEDRDLFWFAESADQIWRDILAWYEAAGRPLMPPGTGVSR